MKANERGKDTVFSGHFPLSGRERPERWYCYREWLISGKSGAGFRRYKVCQQIAQIAQNFGLGFFREISAIRW